MPLPLKTYEEAVDFLFEFVDYEKINKYKYSIRDFNLDRIEELMGWLGAPHRQFPAVHIAGTKGKGSTAIMARSILGAAGKRAGLYTQPHLTDLTERVTVDGAPIPREDLLAIVNEMAPRVQKQRMAKPYESPTFFDLITAVAFKHFADSKVDFGVVEVGLGGRLDSTNVCCPAVCAITRLDYDHVDRLGGTLDKIAFEKAGIIKPGVPVVSWPQEPQAEAVIERVAAERGAPLAWVGRDVTLSEVTADFRDSPELCFGVKGLLGEYENLRLPLLGRHQAMNAALAIAALERLAEAGKIELAPDIVRQGLAEARCPARMEPFPGPPLVLLDGAHNVVSIRGVCDVIDERLKGRRVVLVFGVARDKDYPAMLKLILPRVDAAVFSKSDSPRAVEPEELAELARGGGFAPETREAPAEALARARELAGPEGVVLVTGSFYLAGNIRPLLA